jgi:hypothetical protein
LSLSSSQQDMSGPILGDLSNNRWSGELSLPATAFFASNEASTVSEAATILNTTDGTNATRHFFVTPPGLRRWCPGTWLTRWQGWN